MNAQNARTTKRPAPKGKRRFLTRKRILLTLLALFLAGVATVAVAWVAIGIPTPNQLAEAQASIVYYSDGKTEMDRITQMDGNRESVPLSKVPVHVQHALLAAEDRSFYQNSGVSPTGIGRALVAAIKGGPTQGGSTITQQYVKNYFLTQDQTLTRKGKELIISLKIDQQKSKSEILADYLNTIYYGRGAYGIQTASKAYFDKDVSQLTVSEGALLASVIRGPGFYDPSLGAQQKKNAQARVNYVLDGMQAEGWLTPAQRAKAKFPTVISPKAKKTKGGSIGYITADVQQELRSKLRLTDAEVDRGGLRITTTINKQAQDAAVKAVQDNMPTGPGTSTLHAGLAAVEPGNGAVVAMYGGKDYTKVQLNSATAATMQAGSTFKAFGLIAALEQGISTHTTFPGYSPQTFPEFGKGKDGGDPQLRRRAVRQHRPADRHGALGQHRLRPAQHRGRRRQDARGGDRGRRAGRHPRPGGQPLQHLRYGEPARHRHGQRLRDDRGQGHAGHAVPGQEGHQRRRLGELQGRRSRPRSPSTRTWPSTPPRR